MLNAELYISGTRVDMFKDENIQITDTIQNARDISKVFTAFSQSFSIPASKTNNKLFKHYHNPKVLQGQTGVDARYRFDAEIRINGFNYKSGTIKLNDITLKDNKPYSYSCVFHDEFADLNDTLKDGTLDTLDLTAYDHDYDLATVRAGAILGLAGTPMASHADADIMYPLITHTKRYEIDSSLTGVEMYDTTDGNGLEYDQLKPAIRVSLILDAIEAKYPITFSADFFSQADFADLYMWLCRNAGPVVSTGKSISLITPSTLTWDTLNEDVMSYGGRDLVLINKFTDGYETQVDWTIEITSVTGTGNFTLYFEDVYATKDRLFQVYDDHTVSGPYATYTFSYPTPINYKYYQPQIKILSDAGITSVDIKVTAVRRLYDSSGVTDTDTGVYTETFVPVAGSIAIAEQIPQMKILDFLTGLFKMFNLTAYLKDDGEIYVDKLDNFYALGSDIDITEYVDINQSTVAPPIPYDEIEFKYVKSKYILADQFEQLFGTQWGGGRYKLSWDLGTGKYTVDIPFEHIMFEAITDINTGDPTAVLMGIAVDNPVDSSELNSAAPSAPLLFYVKATQTLPGGNRLIWSDAVDSTYYAMASNLSYIADPDLGGYYSLHFDAEYDEFSGNTLENSLYKNAWETYIIDTYGGGSRIIKTTAYLPPKVILTYNLYDRIIINGQSHKINSIQIDLLDGKTELELITE